MRERAMAQIYQTNPGYSCRAKGLGLVGLREKPRNSPGNAGICPRDIEKTAARGFP